MEPEAEIIRAQLFALRDEAYNIPRIGRSGSSIKQKPTTEEQTYGF